MVFVSFYEIELLLRAVFSWGFEKLNQSKHNNLSKWRSTSLANENSLRENASNQIMISFSFRFD